jgi:hypothetical protein
MERAIYVTIPIITRRGGGMMAVLDDNSADPLLE